MEINHADQMAVVVELLASASLRVLAWGITLDATVDRQSVNSAAEDANPAAAVDAAVQMST